MREADVDEELHPGFITPTKVQAENIAAIERSIGKLGFERAVAEEYDHRMDLFGTQTKQYFQGFGVFVVLMQGVLEFVGLFIDFLCPGLLPGTAEYPSLHVFSFDYKDTEFWNDDVINLSAAIFGRQGHIFY